MTDYFLHHGSIIYTFISLFFGDFYGCMNYEKIISKVPKYRQEQQNFYHPIKAKATSEKKKNL